jgi:hypothetical protein
LFVYYTGNKEIKVMKSEIKFKAVGRKDYMGFQWFQCSENGVKYKALDASHALEMYNQLNNK